MTPKFDQYLESVITLFTESVSFSVQGTTTSVTSIGVLAFNLNELMHQFMKKNNIEKPNVYDIIAMDGDAEWDDKEGVINFYSGETSDEMTAKCMSFLKYQIGEYDSELLNRPYVETSGIYGKDVWRLKVKVNANPTANPPEVNITNTSARVILRDILNYGHDENTFSARELLMKIEQVEDNDYTIGKAVTPDVVDGRNYDQGMSDDRIRGTLQRLKELCEWAIENDFSTITTS